MAPWKLSQSEAFASLKRRFAEKWLLNPQNGCWEWTATINHGYGIISRLVRGRSKLVHAHRVSYELHKGPIPDGLHIDHLCVNRRCVNPEHLEAVTQTENNRRAGFPMAAFQLEKTHCPQGHPYDEENTYWLKGPRRDCRIYRNERARRIRLRNKQKR